MRIGIDCSSLLTVKTGIGYYTQNLVKELLEIDEENQYVLFLNSYSKKLQWHSFFGKPHIKLSRYKIPGPLLLRSWRYLNFPPIELFTGKVDIMHSPSGYILPQMRGKKVVTIHDVYFARHPDKTDKLGGQYLNKTLPKKLKTVDKIIVDSLFTKNEVKEIFNIQDEKIRVIYPGVNEAFKKIFDTSLLEAVRNEYCLPQNFILCVSTLEPRKNIEGLILAYKRLKEILNNPPSLVIAGPKGWQYDEVFNLVMSLGLTQEVIFIGYVSEEHLPIIYNLALLFIYPSFYEGFGLPVIEAMACGLPTIVSHTSSLKEIANEAALFIDPHNCNDMASAMKELIISHSLREELSHKSLNNARNFLWKQCARKTLEVYKEVQ